MHIFVIILLRVLSVNLTKYILAILRTNRNKIYIFQIVKGFAIFRTFNYIEFPNMKTILRTITKLIRY